MSYHPKSLESFRALVYYSEIKLFPLQAAHRCFNRRTFANVEPPSFEWFGVANQVLCVIIKNEHFEVAAVRFIVVRAVLNSVFHLHLRVHTAIENSASHLSETGAANSRAKK